MSETRMLDVGVVRRSVRVVVVVAVFVLWLVVVGSAWATQGHGFADQFGPAPFSDVDGSFQGGGPSGLAIRPSTGDVFAVDGGHTDGAGGALPRIERFDLSGAYQGSIAVNPGSYQSLQGIVVDDAGSGAVYLSALDANFSPVVVKYSAAGVLLYQLDPGVSGTSLGFPAQMAVDPVDGTLYVSATDTASGLPVIDKFDPTGAFVSSFDGSGGAAPDGAFGAIAGLAVDGNQDLFVADSSRSKVYRYAATGAYESTVDDGSQGAVGPIATDPASDEVYIVEGGPLGSSVARYSAGGTARIDQFGFTRIGTATGIVVSGADGAVYTADSVNAVVERFTSFAGASVVTMAQTGVSSTGATLNGTVNPEAIAGTSYHFEWGVDQAYGQSTPDVDPGAGSSAVPVSEALADLLPNTAYHYRLVATSPAGTIYGQDRSFTTLPAPPVLDASPPLAVSITPDGVTLTGSVTPRGSDTLYHFDYGTSTAYGTSTPDAGPISGQDPVAVSTLADPNDPNSTTVTGLAPATAYHFRVSAENGTGGVQHGVDQVFHTPPAAPAGAASVTAVSALLSATINPHASPASYVFEHGLTTDYGKSTPASDAGDGDGDQIVTKSIVGLEPGTTYHVRVIKTDTATGATTTGVDGTFTTHPAPTATTGESSDLTPTHAALHGSYDTHGLGGSYRFVISSTTSPFQAQTDPVAVTDIGEASSVIDGLPSGQGYVVRLLVASSGASTTGDPIVFATPAEPLIMPPPPPVISATPYGCQAPHIDAVNGHPKPGDTVTVTGSDLGVGGTIALGNSTVPSTTWTATQLTFIVPDTAAGTLPLTINCTNPSNTVGLAIFSEPSNQFTITKTTIHTATAKVSVKVPGPGTIKTSATHTTAAKKAVLKATTATLAVRLNTTGKKTLAKAKSRKLALSLKVTYTPAGGKPKTITKHITYKRGGTR